MYEDFRPLVAALRDSLANLLKVAGEAAAVQRVDLPIRTGNNRQNIAIAWEVESLLTSTLVSPRFLSNWAFMGSPLDGTGRVWIGATADKMPTAKSLLPALSVIFGDSITVHALDSPEHCGLWFLETPRFDSLGRVTFR